MLKLITRLKTQPDTVKSTDNNKDKEEIRGLSGRCFNGLILKM